MHRVFKPLLLLLVTVAISGFVPGVPTIHAQGNRHTVREGETLTSIANRYRISVNALITANHIPGPNALYVGQNLLIPSAVVSQQGQQVAVNSANNTPGTYTVKAGDTLTGIASRFGVSVDELMKANKLTDPSLVQIGRVLNIPGQAPAQPQDVSVRGLPPLPDGTYPMSPSGPPINVQISGGKLVSLSIQTISSGKQLLPLSCEAKIAAQLAMMYGLNFDEMSFLGRLPHSLNPRRGFVGSVSGRFYWPRDIVGGNANGPGGYGVHVEGWLPLFQSLSGFQGWYLSPDPATVRVQIDTALRRGYP